MKYLLILLLILASCNSNTTNQSPSPLKFTYESDEYEFYGTLVEKDFWGPPGYGESPEQDTKERFLILVLEKPINIIATQEDEVGESLQNVDSLQLLGDVKKLKVKINQKVKLKGKLVASISAHHHTPALLEIIN